MQRKLASGLFILALAFVFGGCKENSSTPKNFDFNPPANKTDPDEALTVIQNKSVRVNYKNAFGANLSSFFVGKHVLSPSCVVTKSGKKPVQFAVSIDDGFSRLEVATGPAAATGSSLDNLYQIILNSQDTGTFKSDSIAGAQLQKTSVRLKPASSTGGSINKALVYASDSCVLKPKKQMILEEGASQGPDVIHALMFSLDCGTMTAEGFDQSITEVAVTFTCLVSEN